MSELQEHQFCECDEYIREYRGPLSNEKRPYYLKSEADKVIADLEESHKKEVTQLLMEIVELKEIDSKNRSAYYKDLAMMAKDVEHHKYKRCLDKAEICCEKKENCYNRALRKYSKDEADYLARKSEFWEDWEFRWLKIAEKFKEAK